MSLSKQYPLPVSRRRSEVEEPKAVSFAGTLRALAKLQMPEAPRTQARRATPVAPKRPLGTVSSLPRGPEQISNRKLPPALNASAQMQNATSEKQPQRPQSLPVLTRAWKWLRSQQAFSAKKQLRVCETVSLGEKRFVAVVQIDNQKYLIGGGAAGVSLLAELDNDETVLATPALKSDGDTQVLKLIACAGERGR